MREIPPLRVLCLRSIGPAACNPEVAFGCSDDGGNDEPAKKKKEEEEEEGEEGEGEEDVVPPLEKEGMDDKDYSVKKEERETKKEDENEMKDETNAAQKEDNENHESKSNNKEANYTNEETKKKELSAASKLLRSFHKRPIVLHGSDEEYTPSTNVDCIPVQRLAYIGDCIRGKHSRHKKQPQQHRRLNANDVDLNHPWIASIHPTRSSSSSSSFVEQNNQPRKEYAEMLCIENGNPALDVLQSFIDSLVELGRMDDFRLGVKFFEEWRFAASASSAGKIDMEGYSKNIATKEEDEQKQEELKAKEKENITANPPPQSNDFIDKGEDENDDYDDLSPQKDYIKEEEEYEMLRTKKKNKKDKKKKKKNKKDKKESKKKKRKHSSLSSSYDNYENSEQNYSTATGTTKACEQKMPEGAALSLHNCASISKTTFSSMVKANIGSVLSNLDLTGVHSLTDDLFVKYVVSHCKKIQRLSLKNCRKVTGLSLKAIPVGLPQLQAIDVGGSFNIQPSDVIYLVKHHPNTKTKQLNEIYASGLGWTDNSLQKLLLNTSTQLRGLSIGFSTMISSEEALTSLLLSSSCKNTLERLGLHFVDCVTNGVLQALGGEMTRLSVLDVRGCGGVTSLSGMMESKFDYDNLGSGKEKRVKKKKKSRLEYEIDSEGGEEFGDNSNALVNQRHLFVLARYSGITKKSLEETRRTHRHIAQQQMIDNGGGILSSLPLELPLTCILDGGGIGGGIRR